MMIEYIPNQLILSLTTHYTDLGYGYYTLTKY